MYLQGGELSESLLSNKVVPRNKHFRPYLASKYSRVTKVLFVTLLFESQNATSLTYLGELLFYLRLRCLIYF